ncbi:MAG TPA: nicotinate-nucleotide adenylyltransferase [Limnochordia bacterium]|nr:nicotinate-nucleotide adenylyltransferase [Limnochordia bacterium]
MERRRIGVMGGTFDPIHYGHLVAAEGAALEFALDEVRFVPSGRPPHKPNQPISGAEHRLMMSVLATLSNPRFSVSRVDIDRPGPSYTVETLRCLKRAEPEAEFFFITGADAVRELLTWKEPEQLLAECPLIAATRPGYRLDTLQEQLGDLYERQRERIRVFTVPALAISSSDIRARVAAGRSIRYLLPEIVFDYIRKVGLYAPPQSAGGDGA